MKELKNLNEDFFIVEDESGKPYAINHKKFPASKLNEDVEFDIHPISNEGVVDYDTVIKYKANKLTPKAVRLPDTSMNEIVDRLNKGKT